LRRKRLPKKKKKELKNFCMNNVNEIEQMNSFVNGSHESSLLLLLPKDILKETYQFVVAGEKSHLHAPFASLCKYARKIAIGKKDLSFFKKIQFL
jgi:hypothetical protein